MSADGSTTVFCFTPLRVPVSAESETAALPPTPAFDHPPVLACSAPPLPTGPCPVCPRLAQEFEPYRQAAYWQAMHQRALERAAQLQQRIVELEAQLRLREQQLFGRKTETSAATSPAPPPTGPNAPPRRRRGPQRGRPGPGRRDHCHLPVVVEDHDLPGDQCYCQGCGRPFAPVSGTEDATILEVDVKAHRRRLRRHRYRPSCDGGVHPGIVTAPPAPRVIPLARPGRLGPGLGRADPGVVPVARGPPGGADGPGGVPPGR